MLKHVECLCRGCDRRCVFCLYCEAVGARVWKVFRRADVVWLCLVCILLMLVEDVRGDHMEKDYSRAGLITAL